MTYKSDVKRGIVPIFSIPLYITNNGREFTEDELKIFFSDIPMFKEEGMTNHRSEDLYLFDNFEGLKNIKNFCVHHLEKYLEEIEGADINIATLRITQSWLNMTKSQEEHQPHYHSNSYLSGTLYINCLSNDSINFSNRLYGFSNNNMKFPVKKETIWNAVVLEQEIKKGDLIIFPSSVLHHVNSNQTKNHVRTSLAFDTFPIGEMGDTSATHLTL